MSCYGMESIISNIARVKYIEEAGPFKGYFLKKAYQEIDAEKEKSAELNTHPKNIADKVMEKAVKEYADKVMEKAVKEYMDKKTVDAHTITIKEDRSAERKPSTIKEKSVNSEFTKVPQPKHITLLSKEIEAKDKIAAFKAMMNTNPSIVVVKDLETLKNPDIKKIREVGNYTMFGDSLNHKWVVDNETGNDLAFSQEMIEKILQLDTEDIERMLKNDAFNEQSIDNNLEVMNKKQ